MVSGCLQACCNNDRSSADSRPLSCKGCHRPNIYLRCPRTTSPIPPSQLLSILVPILLRCLAVVTANKKLKNCDRHAGNTLHPRFHGLNHPLVRRRNEDCPASVPGFSVPACGLQRYRAQRPSRVANRRRLALDGGEYDVSVVGAGSSTTGKKMLGLAQLERRSPRQPAAQAGTGMNVESDLFRPIYWELS